MSSGRHKGQFKHTCNVSLQLSYASSPVPTGTEFAHNVRLLHSATELLGMLIAEVVIEVRRIYSGSKNAIYNSEHPAYNRKPKGLYVLPFQACFCL